MTTSIFFYSPTGSVMIEAVSLPLAFSNLWIIVPSIVLVAVVIFSLAIRRYNLPFEGRIFWKVLPAVLVLVFLTFFVAIKFFDYEQTNADVGGSLISTMIFSYLVHLWLLPGGYLEYDEGEYDEEEGDEGEWDEAELGEEDADASAERDGDPATAVRDDRPNAPGD